MYPPIPDDSHWTTTSQIAVITTKVVAELPLFGHGETLERPNPAPIARRRSPTAAITKAPPRMAPQEVPERLAASPVRPCASVTTVSIEASIQCQRSARRMMIGIGIPNSQSKM
jgi:hypothetical protein